MTIYPQRTPSGDLTGKYRIQVRLAGKTLRGTSNSLPEAKAIETHLRASLTTVPVPRTQSTPNCPMTLLELLDEGSAPIWSGATPEHRTNKLYDVRQAAAVIGPKALRSIDTADIDQLIKFLKGQRLAPATINRHLSALHTLMTWGHKRRSRGGLRWVREVPDFSWQVEPEQTLRLVELEEQKTLVALLRSYGPISAQVADFVEVSAMTGLRLSELLERQPSDLYQTEGKVWWLKVERTKTKTSRSVPLHDDHAKLLQARLPWSIHAHNVRTYWDKAREAMGLKGDPRFVRHALRHAAATRLIQANVNPFVVKQFMGHRRIETTLRYTHINDGQLASAAAALHAFSSKEG